MFCAFFAFFPTLIRLFFQKFTGQAARFGVRENDKVRHSPDAQFDTFFKIIIMNFRIQIMTINGKTPRNVDDAVAVIKQAGNQVN